MNRAEVIEAANLPENLTPGQLAQVACLFEATARKPGNVHRFLDFDDTHYLDFVLSASMLARPLDRALTEGVGAAVLAAVRATRKVVGTNTNLGMILLLAPMAAVPREMELGTGVETVLAATTVDDARLVYQAIREASPGGMGEVADQDLSREPTVTLREAMALAANRDLVARQYANGFQEVLHEALPALGGSLAGGRPLETSIILSFLSLLARHPDSLIARKVGLQRAREVTLRAAGLLEAGWPDCTNASGLLKAFDGRLRGDGHRLNPGATADLVTAALFAALRDGTIQLPRPAGRHGWSEPY